MAAANDGKTGANKLRLVGKMARDFSANHKAKQLKKKITISKKNRVAGCQWRENGCEQAMIGRENGARFLSKSQGPSTLKKNTISKKNRVAAANGGKTAVSKILNYYYY